jgi:hypothetical protein
LNVAYRRSDVLTAVKMLTMVFRVVQPYDLAHTYQRLETTYRLHQHGETIFALNTKALQSRDKLEITYMTTRRHNREDDNRYLIPDPSLKICFSIHRMLYGSMYVYVLAYIFVFNSVQSGTSLNTSHKCPFRCLNFSHVFIQLVVVVVVVVVRVDGVRLCL